MFICQIIRDKGLGSDFVGKSEGKIKMKVKNEVYGHSHG